MTGGKRAAIATGVLALSLSLALAGWLLRERVLEDRWLATLGSGGPEEDEAIDRLAERGSTRAIPRLLGLIWGEKGIDGREERYASALEEIVGKRDRRAIPALQEGLQIPNDHIRLDVAQLLFEAGAEEDLYMPVLIASLKTDSESTSWPFMIASRARNALLELGETAVPHLKRLVASGEKPWRDAALRMLLEVGEVGDEALEEISGLLSEGHSESVWMAWLAAEYLGARAERLVPPLTRTLGQSVEGMDRTVALEALLRIGSGARAAIPALREVFENALGYEKQLALLALAEMDAVEAPVLLRAVRSPELDQRATAVWGLLVLKECTPEALPAIERVAAQDPVESLRLVAKGALIRLGAERAEDLRQELLRSVESEDVPTRLLTHQVLRRLGPRARLNDASLRPFLDALRDPDPARRQRAAETLGSIGPAARSALPALKQAVKDPRIRVRSAARAALREVGRGSTDPDKS